MRNDHLVRIEIDAKDMSEPLSYGRRQCHYRGQKQKYNKLSEHSYLSLKSLMYTTDKFRYLNKV